MAELLFVARVALAVVFAVAALAKLFDQVGTRAALRDFGVPAAAVRGGALLLPVVEVLVAIALLGTGTARAGAIAAFALLAMFTLAIAVHLLAGRRPACGCFGELRAKEVGWGTLVRNGVLLSAAGTVAVAHTGGNAAGLSLMIGFLDAMSPALGIVALIAVVALTWLTLRLWQQQGRLLERIEALENAGGAPQLGLPIGVPAPDVRLTTLDGAAVSLREISRPEKPAIVLFADPQCGPCDAILPEAARWQREHSADVTTIVVSRGNREPNLAMQSKYGLAELYLQRNVEVLKALAAPGTPSAVVIGADGSIASAVAAGADAVRNLLVDALAGERAATQPA